MSGAHAFQLEYQGAREMSWSFYHASIFGPDLYFRDVEQNFHVVIDSPNDGAPGFESSTFFFDFVWHAEHKATHMAKMADAHVADRNYRLCLNPNVVVGVCLLDYALLRNSRESQAFVKPNGRTLRFALIDDLPYEFPDFINTQINFSVFAPGVVRAGGHISKLIAPHTFLARPKVGQIHLHNLTLAFTHVADAKVELSAIVHLDLHSSTQIQCHTPTSTSTVCPTISFWTKEKELTQNDLTLYQPDFAALQINQGDGRPYEIDMYCHAGKSRRI
jgi:hypothetical protein